MRIYVPPSEAEVHGNGDASSQQVDDLIREAGKITPAEERWGVESGVDRIMRMVNRASDGLDFGNIIRNLTTAVNRVERELASEAGPSSVILRRTHGRLVAALAQIQMQLGQVEQGRATLERLDRNRSVGNFGSLWSAIFRLRSRIGERTVDDALTTLIRLEEKSRSASDFWCDDVFALARNGESALFIARNKAKLQWRAYVQSLLRGESPNRNEYEDRYKFLAQGGASPSMEEASMKGTLIYALRCEGRYEEALNVTMRTRELIKPLWNGVETLPRMTSHMILCHVYLILSSIEEFAVVKGDEPLRSSTGVEIGRLLTSMKASGITMKADGAWEADAVFAKPGRAKARCPRHPAREGCVTSIFSGRGIVSRYLDVADRLTMEALGRRS